MNTNSTVAGPFHENLFSYQQFLLRELRAIRGGGEIVSLDTNSSCRPYVTTMKAIQFKEDFPAFPIEDFRNHYILVFDLTSLQDAVERLHYPKLSGESLRLEILFHFLLEQLTEVIVLGDVQIGKIITVAFFFEFSRSYKIAVTFLGLFLVNVSVLSNLFFLRAE